MRYRFAHAASTKARLSANLPLEIPKPGVSQSITGHHRTLEKQHVTTQIIPKPSKTKTPQQIAQTNMPSNMSLLSCEANRSPRYSKVSSTSATNTTNAWWLTVWTGWCIRLKFCGEPQYQRIEKLSKPSTSWPGDFSHTISHAG